ncbi:hypothetical protein [Thalassobius sp. I31.1]|uniref:hypothetical protein n=1 Tax=Thalassobius sp. I31.1 TaxID=2109912 RepID=UPI000D1B96D0|nr:hypothetical protein [Thalassobius sp. I31.1]
MADEDNVHKLRVRAKPDPNSKPPVRAVRNFKCKHHNILVDEMRSEVECADCGELLNPIAILARFANQDDNLYWRREALRKEVDSYEDRLRFKCGSCGQVNNITKPLRTRALEDRK